MAPENQDKFLSDELWQELQPTVERASNYSSKSVKEWANIAQQAVEGYEHLVWRGRLAHLYDLALRNGYECPYNTGYLLKLAETKQKLIEMKATWESFDVRPSVLIEARTMHPADIHELLGDEPNMTVARMRAWVKKKLGKDSRPIDVIEEEQSRYRRDADRKRGEGRSRTEKMVAFVSQPDTLDDVLMDLSIVATEFRQRIRLLLTEGQEPEGDGIRRAPLALDDLKETVENLAQMTA